MEITIKRVTDWERVANAARMTIHKDTLGHEPSDTFKRKILAAEHSPIRLLEFDVTIKDVPYFVVMHLVRHTQGIEKFVATSREDRTGVPRDERKQTDLVDCMFAINAQAFINISFRRLCNQADKTTVNVWNEVIDKLAEIEPILAEFCVPECIRYGYCPEMNSCGRAAAKTFKHELTIYHALKDLPEGFRLNYLAYKGIVRGLARTDGECPCNNPGETREDRMCPCKNFRENQHCCCNLFIKPEDDE